MASVMAIIVARFKVIPKPYIKANTPIIEVGILRLAINVIRPLRKKANTINTAKNAPKIKSIPTA